MFGNFFKSVKEFFSGPPLRETFEDMLVQQVAADEKKNELVLDKCPYTAAKAEPTVVNSQITDAVTQAAPVADEAPAKPKRARTAKGKLKADDKSTPDVNEAWEGGKAPAKKPRKNSKKK